MTEAELVTFLLTLAASPEAQELLRKVLSGASVTEEDATKTILTLEVAAADLAMRREFGLR